MSDLTVEQYEHLQAECNGLCEIDHDRVSSDDPTHMPCVTCPFCNKTVDAILTPSTISCPECKATVKRV